MKGCIGDEPECTGSWCREWGFCLFSLAAMLDDESVREEWIRELKAQGKKLPNGATAAWRRFLKANRKTSKEQTCT